MTKADSAKAVLYIELSKPPLIPDLARLAMERAPTRPPVPEGHEVLRARLSTVRSLEELDRVLLELTSSELEYVARYLPEEYTEYLRVLMEAGELELVYSKLASGAPEEASLQHAKLASYDACKGVARFSCVVSRHLSRLRTACEKACKGCDEALAIAALLDMFLYVRYLDNLKALRLGGDESVREVVTNALIFLTGPGAVYFESGVVKLLEAGKREENTVVAWCNSALTLYEAAKNALYYADSLIDLVTLYGIDRLLRHVLLRLLVSRWLRPW